MGWRNWLAGRATKAGAAAAPIYARIVAHTRNPFWYREGGIADDLDGRFAVLASVTALVLLRLESAGEAGRRMSVALTEAFIADMDVQMREAGFGDPSLGKQVRQLVGALAARVDRLRGDPKGLEWALFREAPVAAGGVAVAALVKLRDDLARLPDDEVVEGRF